MRAVAVCSLVSQNRCRDMQCLPCCCNSRHPPPVRSSDGLCVMLPCAPLFPCTNVCTNLFNVISRYYVLGGEHHRKATFAMCDRLFDGSWDVMQQTVGYSQYAVTQGSICIGLTAEQAIKVNCGCLIQPCPLTQECHSLLRHTWHRWGLQTMSAFTSARITATN